MPVLILELSELAGGLAHEIRNPLSTLKVNLQLLAEDLRHADRNAFDDADLRRRSLQRIHTLSGEAARLEQLLNDFLKLVGQHDIETRPTDANQVIEQIVAFIRPHADHERIQLRLALHPQPLLCDIDVEAIQRALLNLTINARQAMPDGGELIIATGREPPYCRIDLTDTGVGIPQDLLPRIFSPFFSTKKEGSGLGLSLTRRIIEQHRGTIAVVSEEGKGSCFSVRLPLHTNA